MLHTLKISAILDTLNFRNFGSFMYFMLSNYPELTVLGIIKGEEKNKLKKFILY